MTTAEHVDADRGAEGQAPSALGLRSCPAVAAELIATPRTRARSRPAGSAARSAGARRRRRHREHSHPGRRPRRDRHRLGPDARAVRGQPPDRRRAAESSWTGSRATPRRCPFPNDSFDVVMSCVETMFAPHHQAVRRRAGPGTTSQQGGWVGIIETGRREGFIGDLFATMRPYAGAAALRGPPGARARGDERHPVSALFGEAVTGLTVPAPDDGVMDHRGEPGRLPRCSGGRAPTVRPSRPTGTPPPQPDRVDDLDRDFLSFLEAWDRGAAGRSRSGRRVSVGHRDEALGRPERHT